MLSNLKKNANYYLAFDTDWVPQFVMDHILELLADSGVVATFFCTSPYTFPLNSPHEYAVHPNFMDDSTQGNTAKECLDYLKVLYPNAIGSRSHRLYWHSSLPKPLLDAGFKYDVSTFCPLQPSLQVWSFQGLWRIPVWWTDGLQMSNNFSMNHFKPKEANRAGLKVCLFHPIHIYLNSCNLSEARSLLSGINLPQSTPEQLKPLRRTGAGIATVFADFLDQVSNKPTYTLSSLILPSPIVGQAI